MLLASLILEYIKKLISVRMMSQWHRKYCNNVSEYFMLCALLFSVTVLTEFKPNFQLSKSLTLLFKVFPHRTSPQFPYKETWECPNDHDSSWWGHFEFHGSADNGFLHLTMHEPTNQTPAWVTGLCNPHGLLFATASILQK